MGANFADVKFTDIALLKYVPSFVPKKNDEEKKNEAAGFGSATAEAAEGIEEEETPDPAESLDEEAKDAKEAILDKKCLDNDSIPTRKKWCEND